MTKDQIKKILSVIPLIIMLGVIFGFSGQTGEKSGGLSYKISLFIAHALNKIFNFGLVEQGEINFAEDMQFWVRKTAHVCEFLLLTLSFYWPIYEVLTRERRMLNTDMPVVAMAKMKRMQYSSNSKKRIPFPGRILLAAAFTVICAAGDEFHQTFVKGRSGNARDVLIDSIGVAIGTGLIVLIHFLHEKKLHDKADIRYRKRRF